MQGCNPWYFVCVYSSMVLCIVARCIKLAKTVIKVIFEGLKGYKFPFFNRSIKLHYFSWFPCPPVHWVNAIKISKNLNVEKY